ncbi:ABC transporter substrate-binding protein [Butyrivibrio proteoclasticus]|uniref:ABC transporter substrate-binding protein n=1 Tax=Butyrivibrio proteoclasticus TaxID=43305 RepID=UPI00047DDF4C|nr:extracellular solute-binding protein [Butyrivibrio proteoclasticus]
MEKKKLLAKKILVSALFVSLMASLFTGCNKNKNKGDSLIDQASSGSKDYVFKGETIDLGFNVEDQYLFSLQLQGDKLYAMARDNNTNDVNVYTLNTDGEKLGSYTVNCGDNGYFGGGSATFDKDGNLYCTIEEYNYDYDDPELYIDDSTNSENTGDEQENPLEEDMENSGMAEPTVVEPANEDETVEEVTEEAAEETSGDTDVDTEEDIEGMGEDGEGYYDSDSHTYLAKFDSTGTPIFKNEITSPDGYVYVYSLCYTDAAGLLMSDTTGIHKVTDDGQISDFVKVGENEDSYTIYNGFNNYIFVSHYGDMGIEFSTLDPTSGAISEKSGSIQGYSDYGFFTGNGYELYASNSEGVFGYDKKSDSLTKILDFMDSDLNVEYALDGAVAISDTVFFALIPDFDYNYSLMKLTKVPPEEVKDRELITVAGTYINYNVRKAALQFNQNNPDYRIKLVDYSSYDTEDDWNAGSTQFNMDIVSGNTPDVMLFSSDDPVESYFNKGVCLDLYSLLNSDEETKDVQFLDNVMKALETNGKLYRIAPEYVIETISTKKSYLNNENTLSTDECKQLVDAKGTSLDKAFGGLYNTSMLTYGILFSGQHYIDWENKKCSFNSQEFINFLELANELPSEDDESAFSYDGDYDELYRTGDSLFHFCYLYNFKVFARDRQAIFNDEVALCGIPNDFGANCSIIFPDYSMAISASTKHKDGAWAFVKSFLSEEYQDSLDYTFPIRESSFDKMAQASTEKQYDIVNGEKVEREEYYYIGDEEIILEPLSKEDAEYLKSFIKSLDIVGGYNNDIINIVTEEASAYFSGQKSAQEVADIIQSRVSIYVNENS